MSIGLHVWIVHQPKWCVHFIAVHQPLHLAHTSAHAVNLFYCIILAHTYSLQFYYIGPYVFIAIFVAIGRDPLAQCYQAFVHVGAYSVISRLWLNHVVTLHYGYVMNCIYCRLTGLWLIYIWNLSSFNGLAQECNPKLGLYKIIYHLASFFKEISNLIITTSDMACTMHYIKMMENQNGTIV